MITLPRIGDRIRLLSMSDDPQPITPGQTGTVVGVSSFGEGKDRWHQIVLWPHHKPTQRVSIRHLTC